MFLWFLTFFSDPASAYCVAYLQILGISLKITMLLMNLPKYMKDSFTWSPGFKVGGCARRCSSNISGSSRKRFSPGWGNWGVGWNVFLFTRKLIWRRFIYRFWRLDRGFAWNRTKNKNIWNINSEKDNNYICTSNSQSYHELKSVWNCLVLPITRNLLKARFCQKKHKNN